MGSGAGFPGLVIAIQLAYVPGAVVHCIESDSRKCAFLREAARATGAAAVIYPVRVEAIDPRKPRSCGRRHRARLRPLAADAQIGETVDGARSNGRVSARRISEDQIAALPEASAYAIETLPSVVNPKAAILRIRQG